MDKFAEFQQFVFNDVPGWLSAPGFMAVRIFGYETGDVTPFIVGVVLSAGFWGLILSFVTRTLFCIIGRAFGFYEPAVYGALFPRLPYRYPLRGYLWLRGWWRERHHGKKQTGGWGSLLLQLSMLYRPGTLFIGRLRAFHIGWFMPIGIKVKRHLVMVANTGGGKTVSIMSMLAMHEGNAFVIDPNGQMARGLYDRCGKGGNGVIGKGGKVAVLDPKNQVKGIPTAYWNPFDEIHAIGEREGVDAVPDVIEKMSHVLIETDSQTQPFWANASRQFAKAVMLYMYQAEPRENQTVTRFRELYCQGLKGSPDDPETPSRSYLIFEMDRCEQFGEIIRNATTDVKDGIKRKGEGPLLSSASTQLAWMDLPHMRESMSKSTFTLDELKTGKLTLFVCAPLVDVRDTLRGWFRLLTAMSQETFERIPGRPAVPTLFAIDEMPSLGYVKAFETIAPTGRKYGMQLLAITQDLGKLKEIYPQTWETYLSSADATIWLACAHQESLDYLEKKLGSTTRYETTEKGGKQHRVERQVAYSEQLREFLANDSGNMIIQPSSGRAMKVKAAFYFKELPVTYYQPDPDEREAALRQASRAICRKVQQFFDAWQARDNASRFRSAMKGFDAWMEQIGFHETPEFAQTIGIDYPDPRVTLRREIEAAGITADTYVPAEHAEELFRLDRKVRDRVRDDRTLFNDVQFHIVSAERELREQGLSLASVDETVDQLKSDIRSMVDAGKWPHRKRVEQTALIQTGLKQALDAADESQPGMTQKQFDEQRERVVAIVPEIEAMTKTLGLDTWPDYLGEMDAAFDPSEHDRKDQDEQQQFYIAHVGRPLADHKFLEEACQVREKTLTNAAETFESDYNVPLTDAGRRKIEAMYEQAEVAAREHLPGRAESDLTAFRAALISAAVELMKHSPVEKRLKTLKLKREELNEETLDAALEANASARNGTPTKTAVEAHRWLHRYLASRDAVAA